MKLKAQSSRLKTTSNSIATVGVTGYEPGHWILDFILTFEFYLLSFVGMSGSMPARFLSPLAGLVAFRVTVPRREPWGSRNEKLSKPRRGVSIWPIHTPIS